ncbi:MAG: asparagine N-glycosylation enzyme membrane subunit Stt3 [Parasphingorhabdus sp.]|jgi:asparagine N-glycosylation enzyme membrane subunit Stt3
MPTIEQLKQLLARARATLLPETEISRPRFRWLEFTGLDQNKIAWIGLGLVFLLAIFLRVDNYWFWQDNPQQFFVEGAPILLNVDGYYYLDLARDLAENNYHSIDENRTVPSGQPRPTPVPLLSVITNLIHQVTGWELAWIAVFLPTLFGALIVFPVYGLGIQYGGRVMGLAAAVITAASPHFVQRTTLGWFDTDGLVVVFPLAIAWALLRFAESPPSTRMRYLAWAAVFEILFLWWWDFGIAPVLAALLIPLSVAIFFYEHSRTFKLQLLTASSIAFGLVAVLKPETLMSFINQFNYLYELEDIAFPTAGGNVTEQSGIGFNILSRETMNGWLGVVMGLGGFILLALRERKRVFFIAFPIIVGCLSLTAARFLIFLAPVLGLGVGMLCQSIWNLKKQAYWAVPVSGLVFLLASWPIIADYQRDNSSMPLRRAYQVQAFKELEKLLPGDAAVWTDWSHGYPIAYYSRRGSFADGSFHSGRLIFTLSLPMAVDSPRLAANWMRFYAQRGDDGLQEIQRRLGGNWSTALDFLKQAFHVGPESTIEFLQDLKIADKNSQKEWLEFLFPAQLRPVYMFLDYDKMRTPWLRYGLWNTDQGNGPNFVHEVLVGLQRKDNFIENNYFRFNTNTGAATFRGSAIGLKQAIVHGRGLRPLRDQGLTLEYFEDHNWGVLVDDNALTSVARKLYSGQLHDSQWFSIVKDNLPTYGLWKVQPDNLDKMSFD